MLIETGCSISSDLEVDKGQSFPIVWTRIIIIHSFYIALFSALEQTHCAHVSRDSNE